MRIYVKTPARLHFGLIDLNGDLGRLFGGLGLGIDYPNVIVEAELSEKSQFTGEKIDLVQQFAKRFLESYKIRGNVHMEVKQVIDDHVGLGSGTQIALAVATALSKLFNVKASTQELAVIMGRAERTGVGTAIFEQGGFVVDGGRLVNGHSGEFPPLIFRQPFPENWHFVVAIPKAIKGLANDEERIAFKNTPPMSTEQVGEICRLIVMKLLPALKEKDIQNFGEGLTRIQAAIGDNFAGVQGGRYSNAVTAKGIELMQTLGACGVGQSSWGPAFYGLFEEEKVQRVKPKLQTFLNREFGGKVFVAKANNKGAYVRIIGS